jgi:D-alanine-D-alanine ligase-like ATP-grasp enzyme
MSVVIGWFDKPLLDLLELFFKNTAEKISRKITLPFYRLTVFLRLGYFTYKPTEKDSYRTRCFWEEAERRRIKMKEFHLGPIKDLFVAEFNGKKIIFDGLPRPDGKESKSLNWMDNKGIMKKKFQKEGIPVAKGGVAWNRFQAIRIFNKIAKPVITKPNLGSRSRHTLIHIKTKSDLIYGFRKAKKLSPLVIIEEELNGYLFRGTLIGEKLVGVVRRDQPEVYGDGVKTLRELLEIENKRPERNGPIFHKIKIDHEAEVELNKERMTLESIPKSGQVVYFSQKTSRGCGGTTTEVTELVHPENIKMLEKLGAYLKDPLVGVDFIIEDISKPWFEEQHCGIIECNSLPFIDLHHYPLFGKPNNVAGKLWDLVLPESKI